MTNLWNIIRSLVLVLATCCVSSGALIEGTYPPGSSSGSGSLPLPGGATNYIQNTETLQSGATFYTSSGTVATQFTIGVPGDYSLVFGPVTSGSAPGSGLLRTFYPSGSSTPYIKRMLTNSNTGANLRGESWFDGSNNRAFRIDPTNNTGTISVYRTMNVSSAAAFTASIPSSFTVAPAILSITNSALATDANGLIISTTAFPVLNMPMTSLQAGGNLAGCTTCFAANTSTATGNNVMWMAAFDDISSSTECRNGSFTVPPNLAPAGNITVSIYGRSATAASSRNIAWQLKHQPLANGENYDPASFLFSNSGDLPISGTQGVMDLTSWTMTISSSTWAARDLVKFAVCRTSATASNLVGDYYGDTLTVTTPTNP